MELVRHAGPAGRHRGGLVSVGTTLDLEQLFGVPTTQLDFRGDGSWRISKRNYIDFGYSSLNRSGTRALEGDVVWNGYTYKAGVTVDGKFDNYYGYVGWHYDIFRADNVKVWAGLSIAYEHFETGLNGQAQITNPDGTITKGAVFNDFSVGLPAPLIGLGVSGAISKSWTFDFYTRAIGFSSTDIAGSILEAGLSFGWYPTKNFGVVGGADVNEDRAQEVQERQPDGVRGVHVRRSAPRAGRRLLSVSRTRASAALLLAAGLLAGPAAAWVYPEHRNIAGKRDRGPRPDPQGALERLWAEARKGHEDRLCESPWAGDQGKKPGCIDLAAFPALAGDHSCSADQHAQDRSRDEVGPGRRRGHVRPRQGARDGEEQARGAATASRGPTSSSSARTPNTRRARARTTSTSS